MAVDGSGTVYVASSNGTPGTIWKIGLTDATHGAPDSLLVPGGVNAIVGNRAGQLFGKGSAQGLQDNMLFWCAASAATCWAAIDPSPQFNSAAAAADDSGSFYYTTSSGIVRLTPFVSGDTVQETIPFAGTPVGLGVDKTGTLYVSDGSSNITRIQRHAVDYGPVTIGGSGYTLSLPFHFDSAATVRKVKVLTSGAENQDFLPTANTNCHGAVNGADTSYNAGDTCTVEVKFSPKYPGQRKGAVVLLGGTDAAPVVLATVPLSGVGLGPQPTFTPGLISTVAGNGTEGSAGDNGAATSAQLNVPVATAVDGAGNLYVADFAGHQVRKVDAATGRIRTVAGNGTRGYGGDGGPAASAQLSSPYAMDLDGAGNLYIADFSGRVRKVDAATGLISTFAGGGTNDPGDGGAATNAGLGILTGIAVDGAGNVYIADYFKARVRKVEAATGSISTVAGNGSEGFSGDGYPATNAQLFHPYSVALDGAGNLYFADQTKRIRRVDASTGLISTVAGGGHDAGDGVMATSAQMDVAGLAVDAAGNLYISDFNNGYGRIRKVDAATQHITTVAGGLDAFQGDSGDDGPATSAALTISSQAGLSLDPAGNLYIPEAARDDRIRKVTATAAPVPADGTNHDVTLSNIGNSKLTIVSAGLYPSGSVSVPNSLGAGANDIVRIGGTTTSGFVQVVDDALNVPNASQYILVGSPAAASGVNRIELSGLYEAAAGTQQLATVRFLDSTGNVVNYNGMVQFSSSDPLATLPSPTSVTGGTAQFTIRLNTAGTQTVTVTDVSGKTATVGVVVDPTASGDWTTTNPAAPTLVVNDTGDAGNSTSCTPQTSTTSNTRDTACSLRAAIAYANQLGTGNIYFDSSKFPAVANSPTNLITLANRLYISGGSASLPITVNGPDSGLLRITGGGLLFWIQSTAQAELHRLTMTGAPAGGIVNQGTLTVANSTFDRNNGSGIYNDPTGILNVRDSIFRSNSAMSSSRGGGIHNYGILTVSGSTFTANSADIGGGIANEGILTVSGSTFTANRANNLGGGIFTRQGITLTGSTLVGTTVAHGGDLFVLGGQAVLRNNIIGVASGVTPSTSDGNVTGDVGLLKLAALGNYGGPTQTMLPLPGSPAICAGIRPSDSSWSLDQYDQRRQARTSDYTDSLNNAVTCVDAGAVQTHYQAPTFTQQPTDVTTGLTMTPAPAVQLTEAGIAPSPVPEVALSSLRLMSNGAGLPFTPTVANGVASFEGVSFLVPANPMTLEAALPLNASAANRLSQGQPLMPGDIALTQSSNNFGVYPPPSRLVITSWPPSSLAAQTGYAITVNVQERDGSGNLSAASTDAITLVVSKPDGSQLFTTTQTASHGAVSFDLTNLNLSTAGDYVFAVSSGYLTGDSKTVTVTPDTASARVVASIPAQSTAIGSLFGNRLQVKAMDQFGNAIQNAAVTYAVTASAVGAGATLSSGTATTDSQGEASVTATANNVVGAYQVSASLANGASASFALTNTASTGTLALSASPGAPVYGLPVTLTATLYPATLAVMPTGNIVFSDGAVNTPVALSCASGVCTASWTLAMPAAGAHSYSASYAGDGNFLAPSPASTTLSVGKAAAVLSGPAQAVRLSYGTGGSVALQAAAALPVAGMAAPSGTVSYTITNSSTQASTQGTAAATNGAVMIPIPQDLATGSYAVAADYAGDSNYNPAQRTTVGLTITTAPTASVALSSSASSAAQGTNVTFTAKVAGTFAAPTGTVSFYNGQTLLGTTALSNGSASFSTSALAVGTHTITAAYSGDAIYTAVTSAPLTEIVTSGDFGLAVAASGSTSQTVLPGGSANFVLTVQPASGTVFADPVTFSVSGLPQGATATLTPLSLPAGAGATQVTLRVQMPRNTILASRRMSPLGTMPFAVGIMLLPLGGRMGLAAGRRARKMVLLFLLLTALASVLALVGCGGGGYFGQQPKSYAITITATSGGHSHSSVVNLVVQ